MYSKFLLTQSEWQKNDKIPNEFIKSETGSGAYSAEGIQTNYMEMRGTIWMYKQIDAE